MYVCICNAFTDRHVKQVLEQGGRSPACVFRARGCQPQCGKCVPTLREMLGEHRQGDGLEPALLAAE